MGKRDARRLSMVVAAIQGTLTNHEGAVALGISLRTLYNKLEAHGHADPAAAKANAVR